MVFMCLVNCVVCPETLKKLQPASFNLFLVSGIMLSELLLRMVKRTYSKGSKLFKCINYRIYYFLKWSHSKKKDHRNDFFK